MKSNFKDYIVGDKINMLIVDEFMDQALTPQLSLLIPTYNEESIIESALSTTADVMGKEFCNVTEIIIVDDGNDRLPEVVNALKDQLPFFDIKVLRNSPPLGKGRSLANGFLVTRGKVVGFMDVDLSTPPKYIKPAFEEIWQDKTDVLIGSRRSQGSKVEREQFFVKDILGNVLSFVARAIIFFGMRSYPDTQCGFKFFKNDVARFLYSDSVAYDGLTDLEILIRANLLNLRVTEWGVEWTDLRESKRTLRRILWGELKAIVRILFRYKILASYQRRRLNREAQAFLKINAAR